MLNSFTDRGPSTTIHRPPGRTVRGIFPTDLLQRCAVAETHQAHDPPADAMDQAASREGFEVLKMIYLVSSYIHISYMVCCYTLGLHVLVY